MLLTVTELDVWTNSTMKIESTLQSLIQDYNLQEIQTYKWDLVIQHSSESYEYSV